MTDTDSGGASVNGSGFDAAFGRWVVRWRWVVIVATAGVVLAAASGIRFLTFNTDMRVFFSDDNPQLAALEELEETYDKDNSVYFALVAPQGDVFTHDTLSAVEELTEAAWELPFADRVNSLTNYQHSRADGDDLVVDDLVERAQSLSGEELAAVKRIALAEPLLVNRLISPSGHVTSVHVNILLPGELLEEVPAVAAAARRMRDELRDRHPNLVVHLAGSVISDASYGEASQDDMATLIPLMLLTFVVVVGFALRSFAGTLVTLGVMFLSTITAMGLAGWLRLSITPASANAPTIILTLAVADSVHILVTLFSQLRQGKQRHMAVAESLGMNLQPVFLTSATTAIGFLTMNFSDAPPFRDLGNVVSMGVTAAFFYSVIFLPALMAALPLQVKPRAVTQWRRLDILADFVIDRPTGILWASAGLILVAMLGITQVELHDDFIKYFSERYEIRRATDFIDENLTGANSIHYSLESGEPGGVNDPAYLEKVEEFSSWYREQPKVVHVNAFTTIMKRLNRNMHGDDDAYFQIPASRELAAQYLLLYEMSLSAGLDLNDELDADRSASRMIVSLRGANTRELREMDTRARAWLKDNAPESMFTYGSGLSIIWAHISERNIESMLGASFGALVLISLLLVVALRSWKLGLLSLIPNLTPALMAFGVWGFSVGRVGLGLSIIVAMTLGIVVDDSVHFLSKYLRARRQHGMDPPTAIRHSYRTVGTAMCITTVSLMAGFLVLALSGYKMNADMGLMAAITIMLACAMDMIFLPALLLKTQPTRETAVLPSGPPPLHRHSPRAEPGHVS